MKPAIKRYVILIFASAAVGIAVWALLRYSAPTFHQFVSSTPPAPAFSEEELWAIGVEKVKANRPEEESKVALEIPTELQHYSERRWFLATQVAEVHKQNVPSCQDYLELAAIIQRAQIVSVPAATEEYILFGVGAKADDGPFTRYENDENIALFDETQLQNEYARLESQKTTLRNEIAALKSSSG